MRRLLLGSMLGLSLGACGRDLLKGSFGCPEHQLICDGACTDVSSDSVNCGACGTVCEAGDECRVGRCRPSCEDSETLCSEGCVDTGSDEDNCGSCGNECAPGARCAEGQCSATECPSGTQRCGDMCVDTTTDSEHCGECFYACDEGARCDNNVCVSGCGEQTECGGRCVDVESNANHCGECGHRCDSGQVCDGGECTGCPDGWVRCAGECVDLLSNPDHCGDCNAACTPDVTCQAGACTCTGPGLAVCDGKCVELDTNQEHCGACDTPCEGTCTGGVCCPLTSAVCGGECVDLTTSEQHCGACFSACPAGVPCSGGSCLGECPQGLVLCGDVCADLTSDPANCGSCGLVCDAGFSCLGGGCESVCPPPELLCGNACIDVRTDPDNCGACDAVCEEGQVCRAGQCAAPGDDCDFTGLPFPIFLNGGISVADIAVDDDCNLYVGMQDGADFSGVVYSIDGSTGEARLIAEFPERVRGLVYRPEDGSLYGTSLDRLVSVRPDGSDPRVLDESVTGQFLNGMTIAPGNWQQGGGYFVVAQSTGDVVIYDPDSFVAETLVSTGNFFADVEFAGRQLFVASYETNEILKITPSGVVTTFVTLPCSPDGLTVEPGSRLFASCGDTGEIHAIDIDTAEASWLGQFSLSPGWAPAGLLWQPGVLLVIEESTGLNALFL